MKRILYYILPIFIFFIGVNSVFANEKYPVTLNKCVDGDTAYFKLNEKIIKTRFLAIDTPESTNEIEEYGKEASTFTCNALTNAKKIEIEYDENSNKSDKYDRDLVWVWVDNVLLQETLLKEGLAEVKYLYGDYAYTSHLQEVEAEAKASKIKIWSGEDQTNVEETTTDKTEENSYEDNLIFIAAVIIFILSSLYNKKKKRRKKRNSF